MSFAEARLDMGVDYDAEGGPMFNTRVVITNSGHEQRNINWTASRGRWELGERVINNAEKDYLLGFFRARMGRAVGFRYKDWSDFKLVQGEIATGDGASTEFQLIKAYEDAVGQPTRVISKPVMDSTVLWIGGYPHANFSVDATTGIITVPSVVAAISNVAQTNPCEITVAGHGLSAGSTAWLSGITGPASLNDDRYVLAIIDANTLALQGVDGSVLPAYVSGGSLSTIPQVGESVIASCEFDTPVRFDTDEFRCRFEAMNDAGEQLYTLSSLPIVEIRV